MSSCLSTRGTDGSFIVALIRITRLMSSNSFDHGFIHSPNFAAFLFALVGMLESLDS
jgi:hypothetical protein